MGANSSVWVALADPNSPAKGIPFIDSVNLTPTIDVLNFLYDQNNKYLYAKNFFGRVDALEPFAGSIGEYLETIVAVGAALPLVTATPKTVAQLVLTPGDWDVEGVVLFTGNVATTVTRLTSSINTVTNALSAANDRLRRTKQGGATILSDGVDVSQEAGSTRLNVAAATTLFLVAEAAFAVNTLSAYGTIRARRRR